MNYKVAALCLALLTAGAVYSHAAETRYKDAQQHCSYVIPIGWQRLANPNTGGVAFVGKRENGFAVNFNVRSGSSVGLNLAKYVAGSKVVTAARIPSAKITGENATTLDGLAARSLHMRFQVTGAPLIANHQIYCVCNGRGYVLTLTATPATIAKYEPVFEKIRASFKWEK